MFRLRRQTLGYVFLLAGAFLIAVIAGWLGPQIDNYAYDWMFRRYRPEGLPPQSMLLTVDEPTLSRGGGMRRLREILAEGLERIAAASPKVVAMDVILAAEEGDPAGDARLEAAFRKIPNLVLACELVERGRRWEEPRPEFRRWAAAVGHVHADPDPLDNVTRQIPLAKATGGVRRWALALEVFRLYRGGEVIESPADLEVGGVSIPTGRNPARPLRVRYLPPSEGNVSSVPKISISELAVNPGLAERFKGKAVFVGVTAQSAARDRLMTPYSYGMTMQGIEIHANAFETLAQQRFLTGASELAVLGFCLALVAAAGFTFRFRSGWQAYSLAALILAGAHVFPYVLFTRNIVFPFLAPVAAAWLSVISAGAYQFVIVRRQLRKAEADRTRYQQAMHFVTHEMRTPLTAIQGSSELMSRYNLSEEKRRQIAELINSESKRLARMIEMFLNVERLSAGQIQLKRERFHAGEVVGACVQRARPLAERKQIRIRVEPIDGDALIGDRELMEYAIYNLVTNAIKYSPVETQVTISGSRQGERFRISVQDQGIGMDKQEVRNIFQKFYRTKGAEASGEAGTGIGLSIVEQIVTHHGGTIEVASEPGKGSCFTVILPAEATACAMESK